MSVIGGLFGRTCKFLGSYGQVSFDACAHFSIADLAPQGGVFFYTSKSILTPVGVFLHLSIAMTSLRESEGARAKLESMVVDLSGVCGLVYARGSERECEREIEREKGRQRGGLGGRAREREQRERV